jgi:hypothetical protein
MSCYVSRPFWVSLAASFCWIVVAGCDNGAKRLSPPKVSPLTAAANAMTMYDTNHDGKISGDELEKCASLKAIAKNGEVTAEMISAQISEWQKGNIGRVSVSVRILHNGQPLANASVKVVPEKFMGADIQSAVDTTIANGGVGLSVPAGPGVPKGMSPGFYRIEVTKDGESIPAKYNTETTLGLAVLGDVNGTPFNLVY